MALTSKSLFVFGLQVTKLNSSLDFKAASMGPTIQASLPLGFYSVTSLADAVAAAMNDSDPSNTYTVTVTRTLSGGTQNRITISTSGAFLSLLFSSGPRTSTTCATLIGFNVSDYTGNTTYTGSTSCGTTLMPAYLGYSYLNDLNIAKVFGSVNVAASGLKESVVFNIQKFIEVRYKYEPSSQLTNWQTFYYWMIQQRPFDFTPEVGSPNTFYQVTLEKTEYESKGLGYQFKEMLGELLPNHYDTGLLTFRIIVPTTNLI